MEFWVLNIIFVEYAANQRKRDSFHLLSKGHLSWPLALQARSAKPGQQNESPITHSNNAKKADSDSIFSTNGETLPQETRLPSSRFQPKYEPECKR